MKSLPLQWVCLSNQVKVTAVVHKSAMARTWTYIGILGGAARMFDEEALRSIMMSCIILHNMIMGDEYDYDALEVFEPDSMNTALTRIYDRFMGPNGQPMEYEPLVRNGHWMN
ncbi:hypothetical protein L3X38_004192 [Prunus dulcis]|uniref:Nuclease HARBI1 n=1 Tax=Prunus dulcis TaxID=3755 RepID=A0AAD5F2W4_PRUDU|nr:hypothetical protein L3X38_004192 [Prunus dulcis]